MKKAKRIKKESKFRLLIRIIFLVIFIFAIAMIVNWYIQTQKDDKLAEKTRREVVVTKKDDEIEINFKKLKSINKEVVGWIRVENTNIDYPIMQTNNNDFYLSNNIYKEYSSSGSIFMDYRNNNFEDDNTVIYGHNMKNNAMFGELKKIYEGKIKGSIKIYQESGVKRYNIFATRIIDPDKSIDINMETEGFEQYIENAKSNSSIKFNVNVNSHDKIITLATCSYNRKERMLIHGVLER